MTFEDLNAQCDDCENSIKLFVSSLTTKYPSEIVEASLIRTTAQSMIEIFGKDTLRIFLRELISYAETDDGVS